MEEDFIPLAPCDFLNFEIENADDVDKLYTALNLSAFDGSQLASLSLEDLPKTPSVPDCGESPSSSGTLSPIPPKFVKTTDPPIYSVDFSLKPAFNKFQVLSCTLCGVTNRIMCKIQFSHEILAHINSFCIPIDAIDTIASLQNNSNLDAVKILNNFINSKVARRLVYSKRENARSRRYSTFSADSSTSSMASTRANLRDRNLPDGMSAGKKKQNPDEHFSRKRRNYNRNVRRTRAKSSASTTFSRHSDYVFD
jgi:hypothetical protein